MAAMGLMFKSLRHLGGYEKIGAGVKKAGVRYSHYTQNKANKAWHRQRYGRSVKFRGGKVY
jgi:hypothetical protein